LHLWDIASETTLVNSEADKVIWKNAADGAFSVKTAHNLFFMATIKFACAKPIWKLKAPVKCKFFMWLAVHRRYLAADNLERRGWPHNTFCPLCQNNPEDCTHLFVHCRFSQQVWGRFRTWTKANFPIPSDNFRSTEEWWLEARKGAPKNLRRDFDTVTILVHWGLWKERNARIFQQILSGPDRVFELIVEDLRAWRAAGCIVNI
jgi:hypothetical protein